jgi:LPXTG-site transpeptidase (sortase) family protein
LIVQGTDSAALKKGAGHFEETSIWNGNVGLAAHNRGTNSYFGKIHTLEAGDEITLSTKEGTRTYEVTSVAKVTETDRSSLENTSDNCLTLYTCVRDERVRWEAEEQGSGWSFRRQAETEQSGLCDDAGHGRQEGNPPLPGSACRRTPGGR